jgi:hypothetical protein
MPAGRDTRTPDSVRSTRCVSSVKQSLAMLEHFQIVSCSFAKRQLQAIRSKGSASRADSSGTAIRQAVPHCLYSGHPSLILDGRGRAGIATAWAIAIVAVRIVLAALSTVSCARSFIEAVFGSQEIGKVRGHTPLNLAAVRVLATPLARYRVKSTETLQTEKMHACVGPMQGAARTTQTTRHGRC